MAVNKYRGHIYIIPEDDANRQIAVGFEKDFRIKTRTIQTLPVAGGWTLAVEKLLTEYVSILRSNSKSHVVVLIDSDNQPDRINKSLADVPDDVRDRVFILGAFREPESLKAAANLHFEQIGERLAEECYVGDTNLWGHDEFSHISNEVSRAKDSLRSLIFVEE